EDRAGRWVFGDPIRLTLRWANNSPRLPVSGVSPTLVRAKDRSAFFEYNDRWSLFTFLIRHGSLLKRAGPQADCDRDFEPSPYTLKLTVRTEPDPSVPRAQRQELEESPAEVFMRVSLITANKPEPLELPCFPTVAPLVPLIPDDVIYKDE
ncbi:MAG TPA: hypothetical protein VEW46_19195, partial [Pyrinomonadaceae bacterium]|nr:hypothetical protein [Pyrinomonadaceae bacterium]